MKRITFNKVTLTNYKGTPFREASLGDSTTISGDNATGKSTIADGVVWCLFGKDMQDRKDYNVIPHDANGEDIHNLTTSVELEVEFNEEDGKHYTIVFKREIVEIWRKERGTTELVLTNRETRRYIGAVKKTEKEYGEFVAMLGSADMIKSLMNPLYFANKPWQEMRSVLFSMVDLANDDDILKQNPQFADLYSRICDKYTMEEYRDQVGAYRREQEKILKETNIRILQANDDKERVDMPVMDSVMSKGDIDKRTEELNKMMSDESEAINGQNEKKVVIAKQIGELKLEAQDIENKMKQDMRNSCDDSNRERNAISMDLSVSMEEIAHLNTMLKSKEAILATIETTTASYKQRLDKLSAEYDKEASRKYEGSTICPTCGQHLPSEMVHEAETKFYDAIDKTLESLNEEGSRLAYNIKDGEIQIERESREVEQLKANIELANIKVAELSKKVASIKVVEYEEPDYFANPRYIEIQATIQELTESMPVISKNEELEKTIKDEQDKIEEAKKEWIAYDSAVALKAQLDSTICELKDKAKKIAGEIASAQRDEDTIRDFFSLKIATIENAVNAKFKNVSFKMFKTQLNGHIEECCLPMVNGVPFGAVNTAGRIIAGLDIIKVLGANWGISLPVLVDNAESVNGKNIPTMDAQTIFFKFVENQPLTIQ